MILVTSANGNQGRRLVPKLLAGPRQVRGFVRTEGSADELRSIGVDDVIVGDLAAPEVIRRAMSGVSSVYHIGPTLHPAERAIGFSMVDAAREANVEHFVFSSVLHAITTDLIQHEVKRDIEEHLLSSELNFTILQPANYMLAHRLQPVFAESVFRLAWSLEKRQSMVDLDDVAEVAALVLADAEKHGGATYELAGPGRFTAYDIGDVLSHVVGRKIGVERIDLGAFVRTRFASADAATLDYQLRTSQAIEARYSSNDFVGNANVLEYLLGRPASSFEDFAKKEYRKFLLSDAAT